MGFPSGIRGRTAHAMLRGLFLLGFLLAVLAVHPCPTASDGHAHRSAPPAGAVATAPAPHAHHPPAPLPAAAVPAVLAAPVSPASAACMGGSCAVATRQYVAEPALAPVPDTGSQSRLVAFPAGSSAPGAAQGRLHSGQSPGAAPERGADPALHPVLRT